MNSNSLNLAKIRHLLDLVSQRQGTGELLLASGDRQWQLYFFHGRLLYATSDQHRVRRWQRAIKQHSPDFSFPQSFSDELWEYQLLGQAIAENKLTLNQAKGIIQTSILEVFFDLVSSPMPVTNVWQTNKTFSSQIALLEAEKIFNKTQSFWQKWQQQDLGNISPNSSPNLKYPYQLQQGEMGNLVSLFNGENTLWDIAYQLEVSLILVANSTFSLVTKGIAEIKELPDLPLPNSPAEIRFPQGINPQKSSEKNILIACIDDSPAIGKALEKILLPSGYQVLNITEPLQQMPLLVKEKPDLIFLDLVMPDTSGYSLCQFLRKTPIFQKTPIIILTSQDSIVNRGHAKLTGATDFLSKPPEAQKVLQIVQKNLIEKGHNKIISPPKNSPLCVL